jgi:hypothetical protein
MLTIILRAAASLFKSRQALVLDAVAAGTGGNALVRWSHLVTWCSLGGPDFWFEDSFEGSLPDYLRGF